jgi:hypothetical protein
MKLENCRQINQEYNLIYPQQTEYVFPKMLITVKTVYFPLIQYTILPESEHTNV